MTRQNVDRDIQPDAPAANDRPRSVFWVFFWLAAACFVAKVYYLNDLWPFFQNKRKRDWLEQLAAITQKDAAFVTIAGMICGLILLITRPMRRIHRLLDAIIRLFAITCVAYVVIAAAAFDFLRSYPTYTLWYQLGGWR